MLTRAQVEYLANEMSVISYSTAQLQTFCRQVLDHDAALRAEIEQYRGALEVLQSARDCMLAGFTTMAASYQQGKMALRRIPDLEREIERLREALVTIQDIAGDQDYTEVKFEMYQLAKRALQEAQRGGG